MPVYNGAKYIRAAVDSLLAQTFADFELIISDNASTDGTETICREYAARDRRVRYTRQNENYGPFLNFKFVMDKAFGEYFMWAAADDVWDLRYIEALLPVSARYQCLAFGLVQTIDADGKKLMHPANCRKFEFSGSRFVRRFKFYMAPGFMGKANPIYGLFPTASLKAIGLSVLGSGIPGSDTIFLYNLLSGMEIRHAGNVFAYKRLHAGCLGRGPDPRTGKFDLWERLTDFMKWTVFSAGTMQYIRESSVLESVLQVAAYPIIVAHVILRGIFFKIRRCYPPRNPG